MLRQLVLTGVLGWQMAGDKQCIVQGFSEFNPAVQAIIRSADQSLKVWDLYDMDAPSTWVKGHAALLGDAAHPFQPCNTPHRQVKCVDLITPS